MHKTSGGFSDEQGVEEVRRATDGETDGETAGQGWCNLDGEKGKTMCKSNEVMTVAATSMATPTITI